MPLSTVVTVLLLLVASVPPTVADSLGVDLADQVRSVLDVVEQEACRPTTRD